jgi:hypothetical protein
MRLPPAACAPVRSALRLRRRLLAGVVASVLCCLLAAAPAAAQPSGSTVRDVLIASGLPEEVLDALPASILALPGSILGDADDPTSVLGALIAQLEAGGGNVDTSGATCQLLLGASYSGFWTASMFEPPPLVSADWAAYFTNLQLKHCAPVLRAPPDRGLEPNTPSACVRTVSNQRTQERASKIFFIESASRDPNWGPLGTPITDHYNSGMGTSIQEIRRDGAFAASYQNEWDPFYADDDPRNPLARTTLQLPLGRNVVTWRAVALADLLDFIWIPLPGIPSGWKAPFAKKIKTEALRKLFETGVDFSFQIGQDVASDKFGDYLRDYPNANSVVTVEQIVEVYDRVPPVITSSPSAFTFEGTILGGASLRTAPYREALEGALSYSDNCDGNVELVPPPLVLWPADTTTPVTWTVLDDGPNPASPRSDRRNAASVTQLVTVVDTLPPVIRPPEGVIVESTSPVSLPLQAPQIFDFVDAAPTVGNDAPATFPLGTTPVTWTVTDQSGNTATAIQTIAVKAPGTNRAPTAQPRGASAESFTTTPIVVEGADVDLDSLTFRIETPPENGFFVAPLFPYFVGDLRQQGLQGLPNGGCGRNPSTIYEPEYVAIDDQDRSFVLNAPVNCIPFTPQSRITVLDRDGNFVVGRDLPESQDLYGLWIDHEEGFISYTSFELLGTVESYHIVSKLDLDTLETIVEIRLPLNQGSKKSVFDDAGFLYSTTSEPNGEVVVYDVSGRTPVDGRIELDAEDQVASYTLAPEGWTVPASDIEIDSQRYLYVATFERIFKFAPVERVLSGDGQEEIVAGAAIGWMGGCQGGTDCDLARGTSRGYGCSDATCTPVVGGAPGQFRGLAGIALDPNDNLYIADSVNARVQRFTPEGWFAGQARTSCDDTEACFVRSNFSPPRAVSVNAKRFHVLDTVLDVLYMFDTSVVEPLRNPTTQLVDRARLLYQSDSGFTGTDRFRFVAGDGLTESAPAEVTVSVSRGFHPPEARDARYSYLRSGSKPVPLVAFDPDFPFDTLTYTVTRAPLRGRLTGDAPSLTYVPDEDFVGIDTFEFRVSDGMFESEPAVVTIEVIEANVPARPLSPGAELRAGLGYPFRVSIPFTDGNERGTYLGSIDWGDGVVEDSATGPVDLVATGFGGRLSSVHTYASSGTFELLACVRDGSWPDDIPIFTQCALPPPPPRVVVEPMADLEVSVFDTNPLTPIGGRLEYMIRVDHLRPDASITSGVIPQQISLDVTLPPGLVFDAVPGGNGIGCQQAPPAADGSRRLSCTLPSRRLTPGGFDLIPLALRAVAAVTDPFAVGISSTTPDPRTPNLALVFPRLEGGRSVVLGGVAEGGALVTIVLEGQSIGVVSLAGESAAELLARLAAEIRDDAVLAGLGVTAQVSGARLTTSVGIESFTSVDAGLFEGSVVGFADARIAIDLDYLGRFEIGPASGTVVMSPSGRIAVQPGALGTRNETLTQPPASDPFVALSVLDASHDAGSFEPGANAVAGQMPLAGSLAVELAGDGGIFVRSLSKVGAEIFEPPNPGFGWDVRLTSGLWTTGSIDVQGYTDGVGFLPVESFSGLDMRPESLDVGTLRFVAPLLLDVRDDGLVERVPGFAELTLELVPEPSSGLGAAAALLALGWLSRRRRYCADPSRPPRRRRRAHRLRPAATGSGPGPG